MIPDTFHFMRPAWFLAALLLPGAFWWARRRGRSAGAWQQVCDTSLLKHLTVDAAGRAGRWPLWLFSLGWLASCVALAGPTWEELPQAAFHEPTDTVAVLSLTPSLLEKDVAPSRLARARFELQDLLAEAEGTVGLVIYAEEAYPVTPLTDDAKVITETIPILEPRLMPGRGARLDRGIEEALALLENANAKHGRIVLITDSAGERPDAAFAAAQRAGQAGHVVSVLSLAGPSPLLSEVAEAGGGAFVPIRHDDQDIAQVLAAGAHRAGDMAGLRQSSVDADVWRDMGAYVLLIPLLLAPLAFRKGWAAALGLFFVIGVGGTEAEAGVVDWFKRPDQQGATAFEAGDHGVAAEFFEDEEWQGVARYRDGNFEAAIDSLSEVDTPRGHYNMGNALARAGRLEDALAAYDETLADAPDHADAQHNRDLVERLLEEQQRPEQQEQQQNSSADQEDGEGEPDQAQQPQNGEEGQSSDSDPASSKEPPSSQGEDTSDVASNDDASGEREREQTENDSGSGPQEESPAETQTAAADEPQAGAADPDVQSTPQDDPASPTTHAQNETERQPASPEDDARAREHAQQSPDETREGPGEQTEREPSAVAAAQEPTPLGEREQEIEHLLSRVPDDPSGLLKEKLRRRYAEKQGLAWGSGGRR